MRSNRARVTTAAAVLAVVLVLSACALPSVEGPLRDDPAGTVLTLVATLPVELELPTFAAKTATPPPIQTGAPEESIAVFFSDPLARENSGGPERGLIEAVQQAQTSVDMAIYNISLDELADALIDAHRRGVTVRMVMESEAMDRRVPQNLLRAGIPITGDQQEGLMHNKFTIVDGQEVWLGSMNYTAASAYDDANNLVRIRDREMALNYAVNFEEMFAQRRFGRQKQPNTPYPQVDVGGAPVEVYFSPDDGVAEHVTAALYEAADSVDVLAYSFTRDDFAEAMIDRARAGARVRVIFDAEQYAQNTGTEYDNLRGAGIDARLDGLPGLLHDKVIIIDRQVVITGSYNFSGNAERANDENLVIIHSPEIAAQYLEHFEQIYGASK